MAGKAEEFTMRVETDDAAVELVREIMTEIEAAEAKDLNNNHGDHVADAAVRGVERLAGALLGRAVKVDGEPAFVATVKMSAREEVLAMHENGPPNPSELVQLIEERNRLREDLRVALTRADHAEREAKIGSHTPPFDTCHGFVRAKAAEQLCVALADALNRLGARGILGARMTDDVRVQVDAMRARSR